MREFLQKSLITINNQELTVAQLIIAPLLLVLGIWLIRWLGKRIAQHLESQEVSADAVHLFRRMFFILCSLVLVFTALDLLNVPLTAFAFVSGAVAIGVGFGAQNIINNFISGWILMWERPIKIGDFLEISETRGTVEAINTRSTRIRRIDGVHLLVPNSHLLENTVVNWTLVDRLTRTVVRVGVAYGSPVKRVAELIEQATREQKDVLETPSPLVIFEDFGDSALVFDVYFWINAIGDRDLRVIRSNIRFRIDELFRESDITIAFPQRDIHVDGTLQISKPGSEES